MQVELCQLASNVFIANFKLLPSILKTRVQEPPIPERTGFNTLASRNNTMNLQAGERIGYRGHTQYNETYEDQEPSVMDNPQPLTHMTYKQNELELNVAGKIRLSWQHLLL